MALSILSLVGPRVHAGDETAAAGEPATVAPITEEECAVFGRKMAELINGGTAAGVVDYFDPYVLADRVLLGLDLSKRDRQDITGGFTGGLKETLKREFPKFVAARFCGCRRWMASCARWCGCSPRTAR